jgi:hypothetical protein
MKTFFSVITALFSILALLISGFTAYKVFTLDQELDALRSPSTQPAVSSSSSDSSAPPATNGATPAIQPGQMIQPALKNAAKVELLSVRRIQDPETGTRDVVNVQFRVRRIAPDSIVTQPGFNTSFTRAINPETNEVYKLIEGRDSSDSSSIAVGNMREGASVDAHAWLKVPEGVSTIDIYVPDTQTFKNVPIS